VVTDQRPEVRPSDHFRPLVYSVSASNTSMRAGLRADHDTDVQAMRAWNSCTCPGSSSRSRHGIDTYAVDYPASYNFLSTRNGANDAAAHIADMAARCPGTRIVLGGFSQGAAVVSMLAGVPPVGDRIGSIGSAPPLPPDSAGTVAAVAVFGNPGNRFGTHCRPTASSQAGQSTYAVPATPSALRAEIGPPTTTTTDRLISTRRQFRSKPGLAGVRQYEVGIESDLHGVAASMGPGPPQDKRIVKSRAGLPDEC
jgi:hypothetical protein